MEHALVSGGAGFIGSHLCAALLARDLHVTCVDNLLTGSKDNIAALLDDARFTFMECDVASDDVQGRLLESGEDTPAYIFHLASPASVVDYLRFPLETLRVNSEGTRRLLELARRSGARVLFASTSEIYGDPEVHPQTEGYWGNVNPNGLRSCYDESKRFAEALTAQYWRSFGVDARIVRIFNTYGPHSRLSDGRVVPNFIGQALRGEPITVYGTGMQTRSFCYVSDLVAGLLAVMFTPDQAGEVFNLGNPREHTILEFAEIVTRLCQQGFGKQIVDQPAIEWRPLPEDDPTRRRPDIGKATQVLGWRPVVDLETGLRLTIEWFQAQAGAQGAVDEGTFASVAAADVKP